MTCNISCKCGCICLKLNSKMNEWWKFNFRPILHVGVAEIQVKYPVVRTCVPYHLTTFYCAPDPWPSLKTDHVIMVLTYDKGRQPLSPTIFILFILDFQKCVTLKFTKVKTILIWLYKICCTFKGIINNCVFSITLWGWTVYYWYLVCCWW